MGKSGKLFKAFVAGVKAFKSPSKERAEKDRSSSKADKDHVRKGGKEKCLWSLGKSSSRNRDSLSATTAFLDSPETKSVQVENLHYKDVLPSSVSVAPDSGDASKFLKNIQDKSIASSGPLSHTREFEHEELAAIKIQAATRRYLAARQVFRALRALVRLQALVRGRRVRKQAATSLRCMQALVRVQALARGGRIRSSELGQLIQKHIQQTRQQRKKPVAEGWVSSTATLQQWQAKAQGKQDAVMKRQRALVYAFSEQLNRSTPKQSSSILALDYQPDKSHWGWVWLERWMAAQSAGISHGVAKEQRNKNDILKRRPDATLNPEEFLGGCLPLSEPVDNDSLTSTGYGNVGIHEDVPGNHAVQESPPAIEKENTIFCALEQEVEQLKDEKDEHVVFEMPTVENVPVSSSVVNRPQPSLPPPPPPPPPVSIRVVPKLSPCCPLTPPVEMVLSLPPPVSMKSVQRAPAPPPPPPPPRTPYAKTANPLVAHKSSSSECQQAACPVNVCSSQDLVGGETSSTGGMHVRFPLSAVSALSDLPRLPSVSSVSSMPIIQPVIESFPAPSIPESYHEPLLYPQVSHTTSSIMSKNGMNTQVVCENAAVFIPTSSTSNFLTKTSSPSQPSATPIFSPEVLALSSQHYTVSRTPLIIPNVIEEDMLDLLEEAKMATSVENLTLTGEAGLNRVDVTAPGGGFSVDRKAGNTDQSDIDMDVDEPDDALVLKTDEAIQVTSPAANGRGDLSSASPGEKATEVVSIKHAVSPTSKQGQPTPEAVSPSVPNYMATTKSSKAKIRSLNSPTQKLDSPKQKSDSPKPRFDSSKQKVDSPKPRFDSSKQKIDSPKQKLDFLKQRLDSSKQKVEPAVRRRHSLSTLEGKVSPGTNKSAMHMRASSKGQLASLRADTSTEDAACANGDSCSLEK